MTASRSSINGETRGDKVHEWSLPLSSSETRSINGPRLSGSGRYPAEEGYQPAGEQSRWQYSRGSTPARRPRSGLSAATREGAEITSLHRLSGTARSAVDCHKPLLARSLRSVFFLSCPQLQLPRPPQR